MKKVEILTTDLYRLLIGELRYAYSRNNHLMPSAAYDEAKRLLSVLFEADDSLAIAAAKQLCEECINDQLNAHFSNGLDDQWGNRAEAIDFINHLIDFVHKKGDVDYLPYNYRAYEANVEKESKLRFDLYKIDDFDFVLSDVKRDGEVIAGPLSRKEIDNYLFSEVLKTDTATFNRKLLVNSNDNIIGEIFKFINPETCANQIYAVCLADNVTE